MSQLSRPSRSSGTAATLALVAVVVLLAGGGLWWVWQQDDTDPAGDGGGEPTGGAEERSGEEQDGDDGGRGDGSDADPGLGEAAEDIAAQDYPDEPRVLVISVDGLGSSWVTQETTPTIADLLAQGAGTVNARTEYEQTVTLPNHTGMVTGDRVDAGKGGHGVTWNNVSARSVVPGTESVFTTIDDAGGSSAVFVGKEKFEMWGRAWPGAIDELRIKKGQSGLVDEAIASLRTNDHDLTFLHLAGPDSAGHDATWGSKPYLTAVRTADAHIDRVVSAIVADPELAEDLVVIVTADHGGLPGTTQHVDQRRPENYTIPFVAWGPGITPGDLYALNPDYRDPGQGRPGYGGPQPVRNGDVANLVTDLLGLGPVPGSEFDTEHDLDVR